jgi:Family of unknown function (DUF6982)
LFGRASAANKKVLVARFDRAPLQGFVQTPGGLQADALELLTPEGTVIRVPYSETKAVCFVRDFENTETWKRNRSFAARPKSPGLWIQLRFRDGDTLEGLIPNNLLQVESAGYSVVPPDPTFQNQRVFVPREALEAIQVLGVIGSPLRRRAKEAAAKEKENQLEMFD